MLSFYRFLFWKSDNRYIYHYTLRVASLVVWRPWENYRASLRRRSQHELAPKAFRFGGEFKRLTKRGERFSPMKSSPYLPTSLLVQLSTSKKNPHVYAIHVYGRFRFSFSLSYDRLAPWKTPRARLADCCNIHHTIFRKQKEKNHSCGTWIVQKSIYCQPSRLTD